MLSSIFSWQVVGAVQCFRQPIETLGWCMWIGGRGILRVIPHRKEKWGNDWKAREDEVDEVWEDE